MRLKFCEKNEKKMQKLQKNIAIFIAVIYMFKNFEISTCNFGKIQLQMLSHLEAMAAPGAGQ